MLATETKTQRNRADYFQANNMNKAINGFASSCVEQTNRFQETPKTESQQVSKSFSVSGSSISECYFETNYSEDETDFIQDFANSYKNGIILIMTDKMTEDEIAYFAENMKNKLKFIIYYNGDASQFNLNYTKGLTFIRTFSLKTAVTEAYRNAKKGQAILLPKIDSNFDFFNYIDNLN